jgi:PAS domain S-box-containing protein
MAKHPVSKSKPLLADLDASKLNAVLEDYLSKLEQKVMEQTNRLKIITDNTASCLFMVNKDGCATYMNPAAEQVTGYTLDQIQQKPLLHILHKAHDAHHQALGACPIIPALEKLQSAKAMEDVFVRKDGIPFYVSFSVSPLKIDGVGDAAVLEFQDISHRKELERQKDDFIGVASHELKTPVTSMKTYTQVLRRKFERQGDAVAVASLAKIEAQINKLTNLISDLLDATRLQTGHLSLRMENVDIDMLVREVVESMQLTSEKHQMVVEGQTGVVLPADRDRTGQVLINFLSNAIKYSPYADKIVISVSEREEDVVVGVKDFGIGIPADRLDRVFERFMRVSGGRMDTFPGLGLGLYISAQIIARQGGKIWADSHEGHGSTFYFALPKSTGE